MIKKPEDNINASHRLSIDNFTIIKKFNVSNGYGRHSRRVLGGVKFTATGITYHGIVLALKVPRSQLTTM